MVWASGATWTLEILLGDLVHRISFFVNQAEKPLGRPARGAQLVECRRVHRKAAGSVPRQAHTWVAGLVPVRAHIEGQGPCVSLTGTSLSFLSACCG